jgi:hypothetical protein
MRSLLSWVTFGTVAAVAAVGVWTSPIQEVRKAADDPATPRPQTVKMRPVPPTVVAPVAAAKAKAQVKGRLTLTRVTLRETKVYGGYGTRATVLISKAAPAKGITLKVTVAKGLRAVKKVKVGKGTRTATFWVGTARVKAPVTRRVKVSYGRIVKQAKLKIYQWPRIVDFGLSTATIVGGGTMSGAVRLSGPAQPGGTVVRLTSTSNTVTVPASLRIPAGVKFVKFPIKTVAVAAPETVTIKANKLWTLRVRVTPPNPNAAMITKLELNPAEVVGGGAVKATVTLDRVAPAAGVKVTFASTSVSAQVPGQPVVVPAGQQALTVNIPTTAVATAVVAGLTASTNGTMGKANLSISPTPLVNGFTTAAPEVQSGDQITATASLDGAAPAGGTKIALTSPDPAAIFPAEVKVAAGATTVNFPITAGTLDATTTVAMNAASGGGKGKAASLLIRPRLLLSSKTGAAVKVGEVVNVTATIGAITQAPVALTLNTEGLTSAGTATVATGDYKVTFEVTVTADVGANASVQVKGNGKTLTITWPVNA